MQRIAVEERRAALLGAALRVIARDGMGRASTRTIAAEAGMPTASFHYVFASYDAMVEELVGSVLDAQTEGVGAAVEEVGTIREYVGGALQGWLDRAAADPDTEIALHEIVGWSRSSPELRRLAALVYERYAATIDAFVEAAEARFGVRWVVSAADVGRFVLVLTDGVAARWLVDRDEDAARHALAIGTAAVLALVAEAGA